MKEYKTIALSISNQIASIWLNRPERRNAIDGQMAAELMDCLAMIEDDAAVRVVVLRGRGSYFCAGGDLKWMGSREALDTAHRPASLLAKLFGILYRFPKPVVAVVHGAAMGGALGLVACADFVLSDPDTVFSFSELRLGLIPAVISPFVIRRIGEYKARQLMLTARSLDARHAMKAGLVDTIAKEQELTNLLDQLCTDIAGLAPGATKACKKMIVRVSKSQPGHKLYQYTAEQLHQVQHGAEAREGIAAFFEKRKPSWNINKEREKE